MLSHPSFCGLKTGESHKTGILLQETEFSKRVIKEKSPCCSTNDVSRYIIYQAKAAQIYCSVLVGVVLAKLAQEKYVFFPRDPEVLCSTYYNTRLACQWAGVLVASVLPL